MTAEQGPGDDGVTDRDPVAFGAATPAGEWALAVLGALIVGSLLAVLFHHGLTSDTTTPTFRTRIVSVVTSSDQQVVTVQVTNTGGTAASAITIVGRAEDDTSAADAQAEVDHLAAGASTTVGLVLPTEVPVQDLHVRVTGFGRP